MSLSLPIAILAVIILVILLDTIPYIARKRRAARNLRNVEAHLKAAASNHPAGRALR